MPVYSLQARRRRAFRFAALVAVAIIGVAAVVYFALVRQPEIQALASPPAVSSFSPALIATGARLASLGDCDVCHTSAGGKSFAGRAPVPTPFGIIYSTNLTPDPETGIGRWSEDAFRRAMRRGVARDGSYLYPAFPYDHFTKTSDEDIRAIYAFLMTREPVRLANRRNALPFPINLRPIMALWNLMFLRAGPLADDPTKDADWNRGRYLVEGLSHCGACHSPRNVFGAEIADRAYDGGEAEDWLAPALNASSPDPEPWTTPEVSAYLTTGFEPAHSFAAGPMGPVVLNLHQASSSDVHAIATYVASLQPPPSNARTSHAAQILQKANAAGLGMLRAPGDAPIAGIYASACGWCHYNGQQGGEFFVSRQKLALGVGANAPDPRNLLHVMREGIGPNPGEASPIMPGFAGSLSDIQIDDLAAFIRIHFTDKLEWNNIDGSEREIARTQQ